MNRHEYNVVDCTATRQVYDALVPQLDVQTLRSYRASMGLQGVALAVQLRGLRVDLAKRREIVAQLKADVARKEEEMARIAGEPLNPRSPPQLTAYFYGKLGLRPQKNHKTEKTTTGEEALLKIAARNVAVEADDVPRAEVTRRKDDAAKIANLILECRDLGKQASSLSETLLENGRMRTTLVVCGTESYRFSAHKTCTNKGHNQQNVDKRLRGCFVADEGYLFGQMDQERAESMVVAYAAGDEGYINAHLSGNTHVEVARILWPERAWNGDAGHDKKLAKGTTIDGKEPHGRNALYDLAKMTQHGLNYLLSPHGVAHHTGLRIKEAERATRNYFDAFPGILKWQQSVIQQVRMTGEVQCPGDFKILILGRRWDEATHREAISRIPQAVVAWNNHIAFFRLYYGLDDANYTLLGHGHDAILFQVRKEFWEQYRPRVEQLTRIEWPILGRTMVIPWEVKTGASWGEV